MRWGGGGGGDQITLTLTPNPLTGTFSLAQLPATLTVRARVSGSVSADTVYVLIVDPGATFNSGPVNLAADGPDAYSAYLPTTSDLSIGEHANTLQVKVCGDPQCGKVFGSSSLPYVITVSAPQISVSPNPLNVSALQDGGAAIAVQLSGVPLGRPVFATAVDSGNTFARSVTLGEPQFVPSPAGNVESSPGVLSTQAGLTAERHTGTLTLQICGDAACNQPYGSVSLPYQAQILSVLAGKPETSGKADGRASAQGSTRLLTLISMRPAIFMWPTGVVERYAKSRRPGWSAPSCRHPPVTRLLVD